MAEQGPSVNPLAPLAALILAGCATIYNPATGRQETVLTTPIETALGSLARAQMGLTSLKMGRVSPEELGRAQETGKRLAQVSDRKDVPYQFGVIQDDSINAFTLPGGTIYVHTKTLETADDDELAAVLGHEIGHVAARHVAKHLQADLGIALLLEAASRAGASGESARMVSSLYGLFSKGFSRQDELEADRLGIRYTQRAGFDPEGMIRFFEKMERERPEGALDRASVWNRTHPLTSERIARAKKEISELKSRMFCPECGREYASPKARFCEKDATPLKKKWGLP